MFLNSLASIALASRVKVTTGELTETAYLSSWELRDSGPTARGPAWEQPKASARVWQLCLFVELLAVGSGPVPATWAGFWEPIPHAGVPSPTLMQGKKLGQPCLNLMCHSLLMPMGGLQRAGGGVDGCDRGEVKGGNRRRGRRGTEVSIQYKWKKINERKISTPHIECSLTLLKSSYKIYS